MKARKSKPAALRRALDDYCARIDRDVVRKWDAITLDFGSIVVPEVCFGLLARQATLAKSIIANTSNWSANIGPIFLRCLVDNHITLGWLVQDPKTRCEQYVRHGLGQIKLQIEHRKSAKPEDVPDDATNAKAIELMSRWLESQRHGFLTEVNVGAWAGLSTREMAKAANLLDFYNYSYVPLSGSVHSMWFEVDVFNLKRCRNPLHQFHRIPKTETAPPDAGMAVLAAKYWFRSLALIDQAFPAPVTFESADRPFAETMVGLLATRK